jgi:hypothetical protein
MGFIVQKGAMFITVSVDAGADYNRLHIAEGAKQFTCIFPAVSMFGNHLTVAINNNRNNQWEYYS